MLNSNKNIFPIHDSLLNKQEKEALLKQKAISIWLTGLSGSGKTTLMTSMMSAHKKSGIRQSYRKVFDNILICSPTLGQGKSAKKDVFKDISSDQKWKEFNLQTMDEIMNFLETAREEDEHSCLILDDIGAMLKKTAGAEKKLTSFLQNRRHLFCSCFILVQKFKDMPTGIRNNASHFVTFRPKNQLEQESICSEMMPYGRKHWQQIMDYCFENDDRFSFLMIDMSLRNTNKFLYYKKFDKMLINETDE